MTPSTADHPQMPVEDFEELARTAPETVSLEFINGKTRGQTGAAPLPHPRIPACRAAVSQDGNSLSRLW